MFEHNYYDGNDLAYVTEENSGTSENKLKYFFTRDTFGRLLHMIDYTAVTPKTYCYILDVHGNVVVLADDTGTRVVNYEYDAWGNLTNIPESVTTGNGEYLRNANPFRIAGHFAVSVRFAAAVFNVIIGLLVTGGVGSIQAFIISRGKEAARKIFVRTIVTKLTAWGVSKLAFTVFAVVEFAMNFLI